MFAIRRSQQLKHAAIFEKQHIDAQSGTGRAKQQDEHDSSRSSSSCMSIFITLCTARI
jgi:hypothetical protein